LPYTIANQKDEQVEAEQLNTELKKIALLLPLGLLIGCAVGLTVTTLQLIEQGDFQYGLWRTVIGQVTHTLNSGFFVAFNATILLMILSALQAMLGRPFAPSLRTAIGVLLFFPLYLTMVWLFTYLTVSGQSVETHKLPAIIRENAEFTIYLDRYFWSRLDLFAVAKTFANRFWWMVAGILMASIFGVWFNHLCAALGKLVRRSKASAPAPLGKWAARLLIPLSVIVVAMIVLNMTNKALALTGRDMRRNVILISLDTLRADRLGCYGCQTAKTPFLDLLAKNGVVFEEAISNSSWTLPGHGAMLTGVQPTTLGLFKVTDRLDNHALTLAEVMRENGFDTGAVTSYILLDKVYGFHQGFDYFDYEDMQPAATIVDKAIGFIEPRLAKNFFLFLHMYDTHWPYEPDEATAKEFWPGQIVAPLRQLIATTDYAQFAIKVIRGEDMLNDFCLAMYDGEIAQVDRELGRLFKFLYEKKAIDNTLLIVTSDHGEEFRDHGYFGHGLTLYDEVLHVPLIMRFPMMLPEGVRVQGQVQSLDLFPTILGLVGLEATKYNLPGRDLLGMIHAGAADPLSMIAETSMSGEPRYALRNGDYKLVTPYELDFGANLKIDKPEEVFDLRVDPLERNNLAQSHPKMAEILRREMAEQMEAIRQRTAAGKTFSRSEQLSAQEIERLRSLGYL